MSKSIPEREPRLVPTAAFAVRDGFFSRTNTRELIVVALCVLGALLLTFPHSPAFMSYVWPDSGTFQYVGQRLLEGQVLYRDVWDQKPPLIYFLNAFGLWLDGRWGVWFLSFCAVASAALLSKSLLRHAFGLAPACLATTMWLLSYFHLINDGNMTEEFALPFQFGCLLLAYEVETKHGGNYRWRGALIGIFVAILFFLKSNEIGIGIAIGFYILLNAFFKRDARRAIYNLAPLVGGGILATLFVLGVLWWQGALSEFFVTVFQYNLIYAQRFGLVEGTITALREGFNFLALTGLSILGGLGFILGVTLLAVAPQRIPPRLSPLLAICAIALPLETILVTTTRRGFDHYFVALFYVLAMWTAWLLWLLLQALFNLTAPNTSRTRVRLTFGVACGIGVLLLPALYHNYKFAQELRALQPPPIVNYIREHTAPEETVLILGFEPRVLLFAERRAPTRFAHTVPFELARIATPEFVETSLREMIQNKPALIVDTRGYGLNNFTPADSPKIRRQINRLRGEYRSVGAVGEWTVYERAAK